MGNICGKVEADPFSSPGRTVGSAPPTGPQSAPVPKRATVGGPGRTLGGSGTGGQGAKGAAAAGGGVALPDEARRRAAEAAEARAASSKPAGKLQSQLTAQKKQTRSDTLKDASRQELQHREAEDAARVRNWD
ncbi:hypothetical protein ACO1O0_000574 [Amphichorda felina]